MATTIEPRSPTHALIVLHGEYDLARQAELRSQLAAATSLELALLDMRDVTFIDATALAEVVSLRKRMARPGVIRIIGATPHIRKIFHLTGVSRVLELHDSISSATQPFLTLAPNR